MRPSAAGVRPGRLPVAWAALAAGAAVLAGIAGEALPGVLVTRVGADVAGVACVGMALVVLLTGDGSRDAARVAAGADRVLLGLAGGWLALVVLGVAFRAADAFGRPLPGLSGDELWRWATRLAAGRGLLLTAGCAAVVLVCVALRTRDPGRVDVRIVLVAALLGVLTPAITGHASSAPSHQTAVVTAALHAGAAAVWVGGLAALLVLLGRHRALLAAALPRFSRIAGVCVVTVAVTGVLGAQVRLESWAALVGTTYGLLVLAKSAAVVALAVLGGLARRRLATGRTPVLRWAAAETALMAVTLGLAAALSQSAP